MKSGTAQKLVLNMISTAVMISLGRVKGNKMVDMQLTQQQADLTRHQDADGSAECVCRRKLGELLEKYGSVRSDDEK
jgi:N-acetylmuramic acid 6-phosphate etherase